MTVTKSKRTPQSYSLSVSHIQSTGIRIRLDSPKPFAGPTSLIAFCSCVLGGLGGAEVWEDQIAESADACVLQRSLGDRQEERMWLVTQTAASSGHQNDQGSI